MLLAFVELLFQMGMTLEVKKRLDKFPENWGGCKPFMGPGLAKGCGKTSIWAA